MTKAERAFSSRSSLRLALADGSRWAIRATDEPSALAVSGLGRAMRLTPGTGDRELYAVVCRDNAHCPQRPIGSGSAVCWLSPPINNDLQIIQMERIAALIALESLTQGGLLLHGALAEYRGVGYVMAGPSGVGKSTASSRLPSSHRSLCDDRILVVRDHAGRYWAHPWPTWGLLHNGRTDGSWPVEDAVPLQGIFFLSQSVREGLRPRGRTQATALIMDSAIDLARAITRLSEAGESTRLWEGHLAAAKALVAAVPVYSLQVSLQGRFWTQIERALSDRGKAAARPAVVEGEPSPVRCSANGLSLCSGESPAGGSGRVFQAGTRNRTESPPAVGSGTIRAVCLGHHMSPTLAEADILDVEPYGQRRVRPGDVVCFRSPESAETSVRRVVSAGRRGEDRGPEGCIRTRGDNNRRQDPWVLRAEDIAGRVVAARRGSRWRPTSGGRWGRVTATLLGGARPFRAFGRQMALLLHGPALKAGPLACVLPPYLRPRLVEFNGRHWVNLKLLLGEREVGHYDCNLRTWRIRRPFRLFVDLRKLPAPRRWSRPSFVRASSPPRPRGMRGTPTVLETAWSA